MSDSLRPHRLQPTRLRLWEFPGKSTGVGCHCLLREKRLERQWKAQWLPELGLMGDRNRQSTEDFQGSETALYETILMGCYSYSLVTKCVWLFATPWAIAHQVPLSQARMLEWVAISSSRGSSWPWDWTHISCVGRRTLYHWATREAYGWVHVLIHLSKPTGRTPPRVNLKCKAQSGVRMICQLQSPQL